MALFGFNKQKVLASAEKYVQQGKLQNAISEYEKVLKNDAKDLTVNNTVGDLYSRLGETDKAVECFKSVGDAYAGQGFTVKAIAMYKKICKLKSSLESLLKLAELYSQQGLFNDARAQYLQVAEEFLKANELENAVRIFQKVLEMDPENSAMRIRLAEVYVRLNKKNEAWQIFTAAAESLRAKGSLNEADEVLQRMLKLDPNNTYALLMQGKNLMESGDAAAAITALKKVPDVDSNADASRDLLKAYLQTGQLSEAGAVASKLLNVHNDLNAIATFAEALMQAGQYENALLVFDQHADRLLSENSGKVLESLHAIIGHVRDNPDSLQKLLDLFQKSGDTSHVSEVMELLAHASVQSGDLPRSRDLYQQLAQIEPQNALHMQNYQQVVGQLGGTSGTKLISPEEAIVLLDDLETTAPALHQHYSDEVSLAVRAALTDAELFISYNMPAKALGPLVGVLPIAPKDLRVNQRLAVLHTRAGRFTEAALCCRALQSLYSEADYPDEATRYGELADRYEELTAKPAENVAEDDAPIVIEAPALESEAEESAVPEFSVEEASPEPVAEVAEAPVASVAAPAWPKAEEPAAAPEFAVVEESTSASPETAEVAEEIDLSSEWDDALSVEAEEPADIPAEVPAPIAQVAAPTPVAAQPGDDPRVTEKIDEIRFYLAHGMPEQAMAGLAKLQTLTTDKARVDEVRAEVEAAAMEAAEAQAPSAPEPVFEELTPDDVPSFEVVEEAPAHTVVAAAPEAPEIEEMPVVEAVVEPAAPPLPPPVAPKPAPAPISQKPAPVAPKAAPLPPAPEPQPEPGVLEEFVTDLESSLGDSFLPGTVAAPVEPAPPPAAPARATAAAAAQGAPVLGKFVADIEASLGEDFLKAAPVPEKPVAAAVAPTPVAPRTPAPMVASAAASASPAAHSVAPVRPAPPAPAPAMPVPTPHAPAAAAKASPFAEEAGVDLAEMFGELKQDLEADVASADEDPETHYNLGIAFREMGLLDEAIGELQKACQSFDRGRPFPQIMQTYTWLAQCFLEKAVPEAAVRWYERALQVPSIDNETRTALNYELASAYEASGDKASALKYFMDVYGSNIDYRDVSERIKALKS